MTTILKPRVFLLFRRAKRAIAAVIATALLLAIMPNVLALEYEAALKNGDPFYNSHLENAVPASESRVFEVGYRVCWPEDGQTDVPQACAIQYDLILTNKTDHALTDLRFTAHFPDALQIVLAAPNWYNEPMDLPAAQKEGLSGTVVYTWNPLVMLKDLGILGDINLSDFYDMLIEVEWSGGTEILRLNQEAAVIPERVQTVLEDCPNLTEADARAMLAQGKEILRDK